MGTSTEIQPGMPEARTPLVDEFRTRVNLSDTDAAGVIFMVAPSGWAQVGFENLMRTAGLPLEVLLARDHHYPVVSFTIEHKAALTLGTPITVRTGVVEVGRRSVRIVTSVTNDETGALACTTTRVAVAKSRSGQPVVAEDLFREILCTLPDLGIAPDGSAPRRGEES